MDEHFYTMDGNFKYSEMPWTARRLDAYKHLTDLFDIIYVWIRA